MCTPIASEAAALVLSSLRDWVTNVPWKPYSLTNCQFDMASTHFISHAFAKKHSTRHDADYWCLLWIKTRERTIANVRVQETNCFKKMTSPLFCLPFYKFACFKVSSIFHSQTAGKVCTTCKCVRAAYMYANPTTTPRSFVVMHVCQIYWYVWIHLTSRRLDVLT